MSPHPQEYIWVFFILNFSARFNTDKQILLTSVISPLGIHVSKFCWFSSCWLIFGLYTFLQYCSFSGLGPKPSVPLHRWYHPFSWVQLLTLPTTHISRSIVQAFPMAHLYLHLNIHFSKVELSFFSLPIPVPILFVSPLVAGKTWRCFGVLPCMIPGTVNMMGCTPVIELCYMAQLTSSKGDYPDGHNLTTWAL